MKSTKLVLCLCLFLCVHREFVISADAGQAIEEKDGPIYYDDGEEQPDYDKNEDDFDDDENDDYSGDGYFDEDTDEYDESTDDYYDESVDDASINNESTKAVNIREDDVQDEDVDQYRNELTSSLGDKVDDQVENEDLDHYNESAKQLSVSERYDVENMTRYDSKDESKTVDGYNDASLRRLDTEENKGTNQIHESPLGLNDHHVVENFVFQLRKNHTTSPRRTAYYGVLIGPSTVVSASIKGYNHLGLSVCEDVCFEPTLVRKRGEFLVWKLPIKIKRKQVFFRGDITKANCTRNNDTNSTRFVKVAKKRFVCDPECGRHDAIVCNGKVAGLLTKGSRKDGFTFVKIADIIRSFVRRELGRKGKSGGHLRGHLNDLPDKTALDKQREHPGQQFSGAGFATKISSAIFGVFLVCFLIVPL